AIGLAKLGAAAVLAVDNDPIAVAATRENIERNCAGQVDVIEGSLGGGAELPHWLGDDWGTKERAAGAADGPVTLRPHAEFDLIVANILANVHILLADDLARALRPGGLLVTSGIIANRAQDVEQAFAAAGLMPVEHLEEGDWVALVHRRGAGDA
ncbi:MAG TPA: 50S ribosomal protein L11 methyltransferase, partial [Herpetosiphonaceae bacterium]|nr:50S ribosomal protein L11 methyltransferase [Herpetosiphonaceae bacterium]